MGSRDKSSHPFITNNNAPKVKPNQLALHEHGDKEVSCGIGSCRPDVLQCCASIGVFSGVYTLSALVTSTLSVYINSQITTLEKQFGFNSSMSGFILSCNDIGYLLTTLFMSYIARRTHIPRVLGISTIFFGISGLICSIPHYAMNYESHQGNNQTGRILGKPYDRGLCSSVTGTGNRTLLDQCDDVSRESGSFIQIPESMRTLGIACLAIGMILQGFGKSPRYPFIATYIDDNVEKTKTSMYLGIISGLGILGPVIGFTLGGVFSKMYVSLEPTDLTPRDPRWIGAWWLGFVVFGVAGLIVGIPLFFFPRRYTGRDQTVVQAERKRGRNNCTDIKELLKALLRLTTNPIYTCTVLGTCCTLFAVSGMMSFLPKYLEVQFTVPAWKANMLLGAVNILAAVGGTMIGGVATTKLKLRPITCLLFILFVTIISVITIASSILVGCPQPDISLTPSTHFQTNTSVNPEAMCSSNCGCDDTNYFPVCGNDGVNYFSPCHAGCTASLGMVYTNCTCMTSPNSTAVPGLCDPNCSNLYPYIAVMFLASFLATVGIMPGFIVTIRCVPEVDKPLAIGLSAFLNTLLGWFPGPVFFGKLVDTTCITWAASCSGSGACALYDLDSMRFRYHVLVVGARSLTIILYAVAFLIARFRKRPFYVAQETPESTETEKCMSETDTNDQHI